VKTESLDIHNLREGQKVQFFRPFVEPWKDGNAKDRARKNLKNYGIYTIDRYRIKSDHTYVWLQEVPDVRFNSVQFREI
jgi:hypothetical protein